MKIDDKIYAPCETKETEDTCPYLEIKSCIKCYELEKRKQEDIRKMTDKELARTEQEKQRSRYLNGELTHKEYYTWLADFIGATKAMLPVSQERINRSTDPHLNDIPLSQWDSQDRIIRPLAYHKGLAWSLSDTVCVLKTLAKGSTRETIGLENMTKEDGRRIIKEILAESQNIPS